MPNKNRTLIKLDDKVIEITHGKKGLQAKELTTDELVEVSLLDEGVEKLIENDINKLTNEAYAELQRDFKNNLKNNVLKIAGFENRWNQTWEVDHCNGRSSIMSQYISGKVQQMMTDEINKVISPEDIAAIVKMAKKGLLKEFQEQFYRQVREHFYKESQDQAKNFLSATLKKQITKYQKKALEKAELDFLGRPSREAIDDESED